MDEKEFDELESLIVNITKDLKRIDELIEHFKNEYYCSIEYGWDKNDIHFFKIQRTEFSKSKTFCFMQAYTPIMNERLLLSLCITKTPSEKYSYLCSITSKIKNEELIEILEKAKEWDKRVIGVITNIISSGMKYQKEKTTDQGPIKPKGNPFAGESWKDRKHKFKGGR